MATPPRPRAGSSATYLHLIAEGGLTSPQAITRTLIDALAARDYSQSIKDLRGVGIDPQSYIDGLDKAIDILSPESDIHERCVRALSKVCGIYRLLPESHEVKATLTKGKHAVASGGYSDVWRAVDENGGVFAIKVLRMYQDSAVQVKKKYCKEVIISRRMSHPNVLRIEGVAPGLFECCMVSRWMDHGNMLEYLNRCNEPINRLELLLGIIRGLNYLHTHQVVHGDLKSHNIFINAAGNPCLADFGLSSIAEDIYSISGSSSSTGGSVRWLAPELVPARGGWVRPTTRSDIYSLAMVIVEAFTGKIPFPDFIAIHVVLMVSKGERPPRPPGGERLGLGTAVWRLTEECWNQTPDRRPDVTSVLRRFQYIVSAGEAKPPSPIIEKIKSIGLQSDSAQNRINKLDQDLEKGVPNDERQAKFRELCKLCSKHKLIPDSMNLQGHRNNSGELMEYKGPYSVYQSEFKGRKVAVKVMRIYVPQRPDDPLSRFCREAVSWKHLRHPNILPLLGATISENKLCLISEWMDQGNIVQYLKPKENSEVNRIELLVDVVDGLSYMHNLQVVHGNLKGANIYIRNYRACIAGFSVSTIAKVDSWTGNSGASTISLPSFTAGGSLQWMSPELLDPRRLEDRDPRPTKESDCFSLGMVIYEVLCGHEPYHRWDVGRINDAILQGVRPYKPDEAVHLGLFEELWEMLRRCWNEKREARPDLQTVRVCLEGVAPLWHARTHLARPPTTKDSPGPSSPSPYASSPSPSPSPSPAPSHPSPSPSPSLPPHPPVVSPRPSLPSSRPPTFSPRPSPFSPRPSPSPARPSPSSTRPSPFSPRPSPLHPRSFSLHPHPPSLYPTSHSPTPPP